MIERCRNFCIYSAQNSTRRHWNRDNYGAAEADIQEVFNDFPDAESPDTASRLESCAPRPASETLSTSFHFVNKSVCHDIVSKFRQQRMEGQFLDVTLKVYKACCIVQLFTLLIIGFLFNNSAKLFQAERFIMKIIDRLMYNVLRLLSTR